MFLRALAFFHYAIHPRLGVLCASVVHAPFSVRWKPWWGEGSVPGPALIVVMAGLALAIAVLPVNWAAALVFGLGVLVVVTIRVDVGLWLLAFLVPFAAVRPIAMGQLNLTATDFVVALVLACWLAAGIARRELKLSFSGVLVPLLGFFAVLLFTASTAISLDASFKELLRWLELIVVYVVVSHHVRSEGQLRGVVAAILVAGSVEALVGFYQFFAQAGPESFALGRFMRAYGTFSQPNPFAGYLGLILPMAVAMAAVALRRGVSSGRLHLLAWVAFGLIGGAMLMSLSRGAWLGAAAAVAVMASMASRRAFGAMLIGAVVVVLVLLLGAFNLLPEQITMRLSQIVQYFGVFDVRQVELTTQNWAIVERMARWQSAWEMFQDHPFIGVGLGNYAVAYKAYALPGWPEPLGHAHNFYLNTLAETGILGGGAYLALLVTWFWHGVRVLRRLRVEGADGSVRPGNATVVDGCRAGGSHRGPVDGPIHPTFSPSASDRRILEALALGLVGVLTAATVHNFFDNLYVHDMNVQIGLTLGLLAALGAMTKSVES